MTKIRVLSLSDIHLGALNTPTRHILKNLRKMLSEAQSSESIDLILIGGDVFDRLLSLGDPQVAEIHRWIFEFLWLCKHNKTIVRVLEGTPSHDRQQSFMFDTLNRHSGLEVDLRYVKQLEIETIEPLGIRILYVPDEWRPDPEDTWLDILRLMEQEAVQQVDLVSLHGTMDYQLPEFVPAPKHRSDRFLSITKLGVFVGHYHTASRHERIFANGSFDRLAHGEEEAKGCWDVTFSGDTFQAVFRENQGAMRYETLDAREWTLKDLMHRIESNYRDIDGYIRLLLTEDHPILNAMNTLKKSYPNIHWSTKLIRPDVPAEATTVVEFAPLVEITPENVEVMIQEELKRVAPNDTILKRAQCLLKEIVHDHRHS